MGRPVTVEVVALLGPAFALSALPSPPTFAVASLFVNSPKAARFLIPTSCFPTAPPTARLVPPATDLVISVGFPATDLLPKTVEAVEVVLLIVGLMGAVEVEPGLTVAVVAVRERVVGAFSSVSVLRVAGARARRVCETKPVEMS